jgi:dTDP-glucose 4,6-dehydratase
MDSNGVQGVEADLLDHHSLHEAMEGVDTIYNLASPMPGADSDFMKVNIEGTLNLLDAASKSKIKTFVHLSTLDVHGFGAGLVSASSPFRPSNEYQRSKAEAERLLMEFCKGSELPRVVVIRSARAVGSRDESFVVPILRMVERGKVVLPGSGSSSFAHPKDAAQAMYKVSSASSKTGSAYLVKSFDATPEDFAR